jgi:hypothetical protein
VQELLYRMQHPPNCTDVPLYLYQLQQGVGIGSSLHLLSAAFLQAVASGRVFVPFGDTFFAQV